MRPGDYRKPIRLITDPEQAGFDPAHPRIKDHAKPTPVLTMVTHGRRALGEDFNRVAIGHSGDEITIEVTPTEAPVDRKPIIVAHEGELAMIDYIIEAQRAKAAERDPEAGELTPQERYQMINEAWQAYVGDKLQWYKGTSTSGPGGMTQRQRVNRPSNF